MRLLPTLILLAAWAQVAAAAAPVASQASTTPSAQSVTQVQQSRRALLRAYCAAPTDAQSPQLAAAMSHADSMAVATKPAASQPAPTVARQSRPPAADLETLFEVTKADIKAASQPTAKDVSAVLAEYKASSVEDPLALADAMFADGKLDAAAVFYEKVVADARYAKDKDWAQLQLANCQAAKNPAAAAEGYRKLLSEFPSSPWRPLASARLQLIEWHSANNIPTLLAGQNKGSANQ